MYKELVSEINHRYSQSTTLNMSIVVANCVQKVTVFFVVEITNLLEERKAGHLTVVTVDGGVQFEIKVCSVYLPTSLRGVLKCKKGSLSVVYSGQERTYKRSRRNISTLLHGRPWQLWRTNINEWLRVWLNDTQKCFKCNKTELFSMNWANVLLMNF